MKNFAKLSNEQMNSVKGGELMGTGHDEGGHYNIVDNGTSCEKVYIDCDYEPFN
ncbi:MAG: hypothetical protein GQ574_16130 [Crocinitomix sp.]|nr:hypothetical protein [Crocinitomix sp.]